MMGRETLRVHLRGQCNILANVCHALLNLRVPESFSCRSVDLLDDRPGRITRSPKTAPGGDMKSRTSGLLNGRNLRRDTRTGRGQHRVTVQLALTYVRQSSSHLYE